MTSNLQSESQAAEEPISGEAAADTIFTVVGLFLVMLLVWFTIKGKLRDWFMK